MIEIVDTRHKSVRVELKRVDAVLNSLRQIVHRTNRLAFSTVQVLSSRVLYPEYSDAAVIEAERVAKVVAYAKDYQKRHPDATAVVIIQSHAVTCYSTINQWGPK